jgi:hypothetical protein
MYQIGYHQQIPKRLRLIFSASGISALLMKIMLLVGLSVEREAYTLLLTGKLKAAITSQRLVLGLGLITIRMNFLLLLVSIGRMSSLPVITLP